MCLKENMVVDYNKIHFFVPENEERYIKYAIDNPDMDTEEIVWRVNNNLDKEKYQFDVEGSIKGGRNISKTPEAEWVKENCYKFGFILRYLPEIVEITGYASEPWHLRYIGVQASTDMKDKNIKSFEEYKERFLKIKSN